jgi:hypothetical protein
MEMKMKKMTNMGRSTGKKKKARRSITGRNSLRVL